PAGDEHAIRAACEQLPGQAAKTLDWCGDVASDLAARMVSGRFVTFLGAGPNEATARFGAAKLFEASQQVALAANVEGGADGEYFISPPGTLTRVPPPPPLAQLGFHLARLTGKRSYNFPSDQARDEHYATIHRAT